MAARSMSLVSREFMMGSARNRGRHDGVVGLLKAAPRVHDLDDPLGWLFALLPVDGRPGIEQQPSDGCVISVDPIRARALRGPDERLRLELAVTNRHGRPVRQEHANRVWPSL